MIKNLYNQQEVNNGKKQLTLFIANNQRKKEWLYNITVCLTLFTLGTLNFISSFFLSGDILLISIACVVGLGIFSILLIPHILYQKYLYSPVDENLLSIFLPALEKEDQKFVKEHIEQSIKIPLQYFQCKYHHLIVNKNFK